MWEKQKSVFVLYICAVWKTYWIVLFSF
jgi:hypothetical protein